MNRLLSMISLAVLVATLEAGCSGGQDANRPKTHPVSGTVTQGGQPVAGANVNFFLTDGSRSAVGLTDDRGTYTLTTFSPGDGAVPGQYNVSITKYERPVALPGSGGGDVADTGDEPPETPETERGGDDESEGPKTLLPEKYADPKASGLTATVEEGSNTCDFQVD